MNQGPKKLTPASISKWQKTNKPKELYDPLGNLFLKRNTSKAKPKFKWWVRYVFPKKHQKEMVIGEYPTLSIEEARKAKEEILSLVEKGIDPIQQRDLENTKQEVRGSTIFRDVCKEWFENEKIQCQWKESYYSKVWGRLENHVLNYKRIKHQKITLGDRTCDSIRYEELESILTKLVQANSIETAAKVKRYLNSIFQFLQRRKLIDENPMDSLHKDFNVKLKKLRSKTRKQHFAALIDKDELGKFLYSAEEAYKNKLAIAPIYYAHLLAAFTVLRASNIVSCKWEDFYLDGEYKGCDGKFKTIPCLVIPRERMKIASKDRDDFVVPLGKSLIRHLQAYKKWLASQNLKSEYVFPSTGKIKSKTGHISVGGLEIFYSRTLGYKDIHTVHGWRSSFSSISDENNKDRKTIEMCLDHQYGEEVANIYQRNYRAKDRLSLMEWWGRTLTQIWTKARPK